MAVNGTNGKVNGTNGKVNGTNGKVNGYHEEKSTGRMLTVGQAAAMMSVHPNSVRRWADMEILPSYRFGLRKDRRFKPDEVSAFMVVHKPE